MEVPNQKTPCDIITTNSQLMTKQAWCFCNGTRSNVFTFVILKQHHNNHLVRFEREIYTARGLANLSVPNPREKRNQTMTAALGEKIVAFILYSTVETWHGLQKKRTNG